MEDIPILYRDEHLLIVNKPAGLRSIADGYDPSLPHLANIVQQKHGRLWTVHRLDKDTSGVIIFTRTPEAHRHLSLQFEQRLVRKEYHAIVLGTPEWEVYEAALPLRVNGDRHHRTVVDLVNGQPAATSLRVLANYSYQPAAQPASPVPLSLIAAAPRSGYTHQIRAHLAALRLPLVGDPLYKSLHPDDRSRTVVQLPIQRTALHALRVTFAHPATGNSMAVEAPYPLDFQETLALLDR